jgi:hypothetical protein
MSSHCVKNSKVKPKQNLCIFQGKSQAITFVALENVFFFVLVGFDPKSKGFNHLIMTSSK